MKLNARTVVHLMVVLFCVAWSTPSIAGEPKEIMISAAVSLKNVLETIGKKFEGMNPGVTIVFNFGASGALVNQIIGGAPVDILFSADIRDFQRFGQNIIATGSPKPFLRNQLVFIVPGQSSLFPQSLADLKDPVWKKIAIGNPKTVPAGRYAEEVIKTAGLSEALETRLVLCENVRQVLDYVVRGEVEGGFVYLTDVKITKPGEVRQVFVIPPEKHSPIVLGVGKMSGASNPALAETFLRFVTQPECQAILASAGFLLLDN